MQALKAAGKSADVQLVTRSRALFYAAFVNAGFAVLALVDQRSTKGLLPACVGASARVLLIAAMRERRPVFEIAESSRTGPASQRGIWRDER